MKSSKPKGRKAKRMAFYARKRNSIGKMIVRDIRTHVGPLFSNMAR